MVIKRYTAYCPLCGAVITIEDTEPKSKYCPCCGHHLAYEYKTLTNLEEAKRNLIMEFFYWLFISGPADDDCWAIALGIAVPAVSLTLGLMFPVFLLGIPLSFLFAFGICVLRDYGRRTGK